MRHRHDNVAYVLGIACTLLIAAVLVPFKICSVPTLDLLCTSRTTAASIVNGIAGLLALSVAYYATRVARVTRSSRVVATACAFGVLGIGAFGAIAGIVSHELNVVVFSTAASLLVSSMILFSAMRVFPEQRIRTTPFMITATTIVCAAAATIVFYAFQDILPRFANDATRTTLAASLYPIAGMGFAFTAYAHYKLYLRNQSGITHWFVIGYGLLAIGSFALFFNRPSYDTLPWIFRIFRLLASMAFLRAILMKH